MLNDWIKPVIKTVILNETQGGGGTNYDNSTASDKS